MVSCQSCRSILHHIIVAYETLYLHYIQNGLNKPSESVSKKADSSQLIPQNVRAKSKTCTKTLQNQHIKPSTIILKIYSSIVWDIFPLLTDHWKEKEKKITITKALGNLGTWMHDGDDCHAHQGGVGFCFVGGGEFISCEKEQLQSHQQEAQQQLQQCLSQSLRLHPKMALRQKCWAPQWIEGTGKNIIDQYLLWCDLQLLSSESRPASNQVQSANSPPLVTTQTWDWERERECTSLIITKIICFISPSLQ